MAINLYSPLQHSGLFDVIGKAFKTQSDINSSRGQAIPGDVQVLLSYFANLPFTASLESAAQPLLTTVSGYQTGATSTLSTIQTFTQQTVIGIAGADRLQPDSSLLTALKYVIAQMLATGQTMDKSNVTVSVAYVTGNAGNGVVIASSQRGDGLVQENAIAETLLGTFNSTGATAQASIVGQSAASGPLGQDWPLGSGSSSSVNSVDANSGSGSLLVNGGMETSTNNPGVPDGWILAVGTPNATCGMTVTAVQTITISGSPPSGDYVLNWPNAAGKVQTTAPINYNSTGGGVQSALRLLSGLGSVTVTTTGTAPNYQHTVTMTGAGNAALLTAKAYFPSGSVSTAIVTAGTTQVYAGGSAFFFSSNGPATHVDSAAIDESPASDGLRSVIVGVCRRRSGGRGYYCRFG